MSKAKADEGKELPPFAIKLKSLREAAGLTQRQLAERAGLHLGAIFKIEQGGREPAWATVQALVRALGVSCEEFMNDQSQQPLLSAPSKKPAPKRPQKKTLK